VRYRAAFLETWAKDQLGAADLELVVCGHAHLPVMHDHGGRYYLNAGDWITHFTYITVRDGDEPRLRALGSGGATVAFELLHAFDAAQHVTDEAPADIAEAERRVAGCEGVCRRLGGVATRPSSIEEWRQTSRAVSAAESTSALRAHESAMSGRSSG
jgi:hypothetical protein